jgi:hypothetical protein
LTRYPALITEYVVEESQETITVIFDNDETELIHLPDPDVV